MKQMNLLVLLMIFFIGMPVYAADEEAVESKPAYLELQPSVVANLTKGAKHVRFDVQLMLTNEEDLDKVKPHVPALVNEMLLLVSDQDGAALKTPQGKDAFRKKALEDCNKLLDSLEKITPFKDLFFTTFFVR